MSIASSYLVLVFLAVAFSLAEPTIQTRTTTLNANATTMVQTSSGLLMGLETKPKHAGYQSVTKFLGVPYAKAPIGQLRFKLPQELTESSDRVVDATKLGSTCPQHSHLVRFISPLLNIDQEHKISEDCLQLNVFVPTQSKTGDQSSEQKLLPVIVWIPGEGYDFADARQFDGSQLALRTRSIVVTIQYRVGVFGLLDAPELGLDGNQAIHDQLMALRWISKNIAAFGGDRERITAMGRFTGAMSISAMLTAPNQELVTRQTDDGEQVALFNRAILTSGIAVDDWIIVDNQRAKTEQVLDEARSRGLCSGNDALACLQSIPMADLLDISGYKWRLVRDNQLISNKGGPIEILRQQPNGFRLPKGLEAIMLGETGTEGTLCLFRHLLMAHQNERARLIEEDQLTNSQFDEIIRDDLATYFSYNTSNSNQALEMALGALVDTNTNLMTESSLSSPSLLRQRYLDACSSYMVRSHNQRFKRHLQQVMESQPDGRVQLDHYQLRYKPSFSLAPDYIKTAAHGDDIPLIFGLVFNQQEANEADLEMSQKMLAYIGDFVHGKRQRRAVAKLQPEGERVHLLDLERNEYADKQDSERTLERRTVEEKLPVAQHARMIIVEPSLELNNEQQRLKHQMSMGQESQTGGNHNQQLTRSQKLLELHRQQQMFYGPAASNPNSELSIATETSLATALLLAASIVILALMSVCVVLSVLVVRYNSSIQQHDGAGSNHKRSQHFNNSSNCNICDDPQGSSIDAVLNQQASANKGQHAFCNVFAKLKHNHHNQSACGPESLMATGADQQQQRPAGGTGSNQLASTNQ